LGAFISEDGGPGKARKGKIGGLFRARYRLEPLKRDEMGLNQAFAGAG
jgi:hypothetical protein